MCTCNVTQIRIENENIESKLEQTESSNKGSNTVIKQSKDIIEQSINHAKTGKHATIIYI